MCELDLDQILTPRCGVTGCQQLQPCFHLLVVCSIRPFDSGWETEDRLTCAPNREQNSCQKQEVNCGP